MKTLNLALLLALTALAGVAVTAQPAAAGICFGTPGTCIMANVPTAPVKNIHGRGGSGFNQGKPALKLR